MALTAQPLAAPNEHTQDALQALSDTHEATLADQDDNTTARSRAVIVLADGTQVRCDVNDLSVEGAYLIRRVRKRASPQLRSGDVVKVFLFHPGNPLLESVTLGASIVRTESDGGPGLAIRFKHANGSTAQYGEQMEWTTEIPEPVIPDSYRKSAMSAPESPSLAGPTIIMRTARVRRPLFWTTVIGINVMAFVLLSQWLNAVL